MNFSDGAAAVNVLLSRLAGMPDGMPTADVLTTFSLNQSYLDGLEAAGVVDIRRGVCVITPDGLETLARRSPRTKG